ncbi:cutinase family protein [Cellulomonas phragmiteti]|nr:cutinase family protein [Cellulomonas phragmiteti]
MPVPSRLVGRLTSVLVVSLVAALLAVPGAVSPAAAAASWPAPVHHGVTSLQGCADVLVVGVRGSGQTSEDSGGFGAEVAHVRDRLQEAVGDRRSVRQVQVDYQSLPVHAALFLDVSPAHVSNMYLDSIGSGYEALNTVIDDSQARCPDESIVLVGYSQGALVVHRSAAVHASDPDKFAGIVLVADPARNTEAGVAALGTAAPGTGLTGWAGDLSSLPLRDLQPITTSVCDAYDVVCDTSNLFATPEAAVSPLGAATAGVAVHTSYTGTAALQEAAARVAQRLLGYAVPTDTTRDVPIGSPFTVQLTTKPMADGAAVSWRFDPLSTPASLTLTAQGVLSGEIGRQGTVSVQVQVKGASGTWRRVTIGLRAGAGQYCPAAGDLLRLTATPRTDDEIWGRKAALAPTPTPTPTATADGPAPPLSAAFGVTELVATSDAGVLENVLVSREGSSRRDPDPQLAGQRLVSAEGQVVRLGRYSGQLLVYRTGSPDPVRDLVLSPTWGSQAEPRWLRGDLLTGPAGYSLDEIVWEDLAGSRSGRAAVDGTFLTGSDTGWYESYRWPSTFGCVTDGSLVVRSVDVTGAEVVRTNVAVAPASVPRGAEPLLAESGPDGRSLGLLVGVYRDGIPTDVTVLGWQAGQPHLRVLGAVPDDEITDGGSPGEWQYPDPGGSYSATRSKLAVSGAVVSLHLVQWWKDPGASGAGRAGDGSVSGAVYRFAPDAPTRRWDAQVNSPLLTLPGGTIFSGPTHRTLTIGRADGSATASQLSRHDTRGQLTASSDGHVVYMPPAGNGPLTSPWIGTDELLRGYVYRYDDPAAYTPVPVVATPLLGNVGTVYALSVSGDAVTWTSDSVTGGAQWTQGYTRDGHALTLAAERSRTADISSRSESIHNAPWQEGGLDVHVTPDAHGYSDLTVFDGTTELWSTTVSDGAGNYRIHDGRVDLTTDCRSYDLRTGALVFETEVWHYGRPVFTDRDAGCSLASQGSLAVWVDDDDGELWALDTATTRPAVLVGAVPGLDSGPAPGHVRHLSVEDGRLLIWVVEYPDTSTWEPAHTFYVADLRDLARPGALVLHDGVADAVDAGTDDHWGLIQLSRSGTAFAVSLVSNWEYRAGERVDYGGYRTASVQVFSLDADAPFATVSPADEPYYLYGPAISLHGDLLAWSDGSGGVVLSRLAVPDASAPADFAAAPAPTIAGSAAVGGTLRATLGAWSPQPTAVTYQWFAAGVAVDGATTSTFVPGAAHLGTRITVSVTGTRAGHATVVRTSEPTTAVVPGTLTSATPRILGVARVGKTLTAVPGAWTSGVTLTYQWYVSGVAVSGATATTFVPGAAHRGATVTVRVTGSKAGYTSVSTLSVPTAPVGDLSPLKVARATVGGAPRPG